MDGAALSLRTVSTTPSKAATRLPSSASSSVLSIAPDLDSPLHQTGACWKFGGRFPPESVVGFGRNPWSDAAGFSGRLPPESAVGFHRNRWTVPAGFAGRIRPEYAALACCAASPGRPGLLCGSCSSGREFASGFLQIPLRSGHPCLWLTVGATIPRSGLSPYSGSPCRAYARAETALRGAVSAHFTGTEDS